MKKYIDFIEKTELWLLILAIDDFKPNNIYEAFFNAVVIKPIQYIFGLVLSVVVMSWLLTGFGMIIIVGLYGEGKIALPLIISIVNILYLIKYIFNQVLIFKEN